MLTEEREQNAKLDSLTRKTIALRKRSSRRPRSPSSNHNVKEPRKSVIFQYVKDITPPARHCSTARRGRGIYGDALFLSNLFLYVFAGFLVLPAPDQPGRESRRAPKAQRPLCATKLAIPGYCPGPSRYGAFWGNGKAPGREAPNCLMGGNAAEGNSGVQAFLGSGISPLRAWRMAGRRGAVSRWKYIPSTPALREWFPLSASSRRRRWRSCRRRARLSARACDENAPASSVR